MTVRKHLRNTISVCGDPTNPWNFAITMANPARIVTHSNGPDHLGFVHGTGHFTMVQVYSGKREYLFSRTKHNHTNKLLWSRS